MSVWVVIFIFLVPGLRVEFPAGPSAEVCESQRATLQDMYDRAGIATAGWCYREK